MCAAPAKKTSYNSNFHEVYLTTNETKDEETRAKIAALPGTWKKMVGVSGFYAFDLASLRPEIEEIHMYDIADEVRQFWNKIKIILEDKNLKYVEAKERIFTYIKQEKGFEFDGDIQDKTEEGFTFLSSQERFERIHKVFVNGKFSFTQVNFMEPEEYGAFIKGLGQEPYLIYLSNVADLCTRRATAENYPIAKRSLSYIPAGSTIVYANRYETRRDPQYLTQNAATQILISKAIELDSYEEVAACCKLGSPIRGNAKEDSILFTKAASDGHANAVRAFVEVGGIKPTALFRHKGKPPLFNISKPDLIRYFVKNGVDVHERDGKGNTVLMHFLNDLSLRKEHLEAVRAFIECGVDITAVNKSGQTALDFVGDHAVPIYDECRALLTPKPLPAKSAAKRLPSKGASAIRLSEKTAVEKFKELKAQRDAQKKAKEESKE